MIRSKKMTVKVHTAAMFVCLMSVSLTVAGETGLLKVGPKDKCPVCGMFVARYPDWVGGVIFKDGSVEFFDGPKDLFKYYLNLKKYNPQKTKANIAAIYVTEYYDMKLIDARHAFLVIGSDVYGPMGRELIPFTTEADAKEFMKDHKGTQILRFEEITPRVMEGLDSKAGVR
jgi:nitrous oxide reductase accessory protein NosL